MPTLLRIDHWRVMIYSLDHPPAHVHIVGPEGRARIALNCPNGPAIPIDAHGIAAATLKRIVIAIEAEIAGLCEEWRRIHGSH